MVTQGMWNTDSTLMQLPHFDKELASKAEKMGVEGITDILEMEGKDREKLFKGLSDSRIKDIALFANAYPDIDVQFKVVDDDKLSAGGRVVVQVQLEREEDDEPIKGAPKVIAPRYPRTKVEGWWLVIGDPNRNELTCIKRVTLKQTKTKVAMDFIAPSKPGKYKYKLYYISDSYMGCDQEYDLSLEVGEGKVEESSSEEDSSGSDSD